MCFSVPMMLELIPFDCSRMVLLNAEASAKWITFDYLSLTSFDFSKNYQHRIIDCCLFAGYSQFLFAT